MTKKDKVKIRHTLNLIGKRIIPAYFLKSAEKSFMAWQYNACRQTAFYVCWKLANQFPGRSVILIENKFNDPVMGEYDHASSLLTTNTDTETGIFVDVSRISFPTMVEFIKAPAQIPDVSKMISKTTKMPHPKTSETIVGWKPMLGSLEYYTNKPYLQVMLEIDELLKKATGHKNLF